MKFPKDPGNAYRGLHRKHTAPCTVALSEAYVSIQRAYNTLLPGVLKTGLIEIIYAPPSVPAIYYIVAFTPLMNNFINV